MSGPRIPWLSDVQSRTKNYSAAPDIKLDAAAEVGDDVEVTIRFSASFPQLLFYIWVSDTELATLAAVAPSGGVAVTSGGTLLEEVTADLSLLALLGDGAVITVTEAGADTFWLNVVPVSGGVPVSAQMTFAV